VTSARRLYRLHLAAALLAGGATTAAAIAAFSKLQLSLPSGQSLAAACRRVVPLQSTVAMLLVVVLIAVGVLVVAIALRSTLRQIRDQRCVLRALNRFQAMEVAGRAVTVVRDDRPQAFCAGLLRPRIYVSTAALEVLSPRELGAVVAHEAHHRANRDPLRILLARVFADALFFLPGLRRLGERYRELAELAADEAATRVGGSKALASALLTFGSREGEPATVVGIAPERADHLLGRAPRWQLPLSVFAGFVISLSALLAAVATLPSLASQGSLSVAALMAEGCMAAMIVLPLVAVAALVLAGSRARSRRAAT
jgi:Zn-dependent protease with chaperone function